MFLTIDRWLWTLTRNSPSRGHEDGQHVERVLAAARLIVALSFAASLNIGQDDSTSSGVAYMLLVAYVIYSAGVLIIVRLLPNMSAGFALTLHGVDLVWASLGTLLDLGQASPFFAFFIFAVLAAAYRWGHRETLLTAGIAIVVLSIEMQTMNIMQSQTAETIASNLQTFIRRVAYMVMSGVLGGYLSNEDRLLRLKNSLQSGMIAKVKAERGFYGSLQAVASDLLRIYSARELMLAIADAANGRLFLVTVRPDSATGEIREKTKQLPFDDRSRYFFDASHAWAARRRHIAFRGRTLKLHALDADERKVGARFDVPAAFREAHPFHTLMCVSFRFDEDEDSSGRLFLFDAPRPAAREAPLRFLQQVTRQVGPAVHAVYLIRRLRSRIGAIERARVARELHDGVIQSLIGVEMRLDVLKRQASEAGSDGSVERELTQLEDVVREEVLNLRDLMQQMKPRDLSPSQLLDYLIELVDRFRRDTGISASFVSDLQEVSLPQHARRELARIAQEALVNVRKHSGAHNVLVRLERNNGAFRLVVDDDGKGYGFEGRHTHAELDAARRGPVVIKERARSIGAEVAIESMAGKGSRLEITVPHRLN